MRVTSALSIALAAGSAMAAPAAVFRGHLHKRDHHANLLRRSQDAAVSAAAAAAFTDPVRLKARDADANVVIQTVYVEPTSAELVYVTELAMVTVVVNQDGTPRTTNTNSAAEVTSSSVSETTAQTQAPTSIPTTASSEQSQVSSAGQTTKNSSNSSSSRSLSYVPSSASLNVSSLSTTLSASTSARTSSSASLSEAGDIAAEFTTSESTAESTSSPSSTYQVETSSVQSSSAAQSSAVQSTSVYSSSSVQPSSTSSADSSTWSSSAVQTSSAVQSSSADSSTWSSSAVQTSSAVQSSSTSSSAASSTSTAQLSVVPNTITYSPYNDDSSCKNSDQVYSDLSKLANLGISAVRIYGTDCNSLSTVQPACVKLGLKIDQGFWIGSTGVDAIDSGVQDVISWVANSNNGDWSIFTTITVGNEAIYGGYTDGATLLAKIKSVKSTLQQAGWTGTVTTAEPPASYINYPDLCTDTAGIDYVGVNAHPYFDASSTPEQAGDFVLSQISAAQGACNGRTTKITETGYPMAGNTNGLQVPTPANQAIAIAKIMEATNNEAVMFTVYNDKWKAPGSYNVEQNFGILYLFE